MVYYVTKSKQLNFKSICFKKIVAYFDNKQYVYLDTETTGLDPHTNKPILLIVGDEDTQFVIDLRTYTKEATELLQSLQHLYWVAHNAKFDAKMLMSLGIEHTKWVCLLTASLVIYSGLKFDKHNKSIKHGLDSVLKRELNVEMKKDIRKNFINKPDTQSFSKVEITYAANDIKYMPELLAKFLKYSESFNLNYLINPNNYNLENKFITVIASMEYVGIRFNMESWLHNALEVKKYLDSISISLKEELNKLKIHFPKLKHILSYNFGSTDDIFHVFKATNELSKLTKRDDLEDFILTQTIKERKKARKKSEVSIEGEVVGKVGKLFNIPEATVKIKDTQQYSLGESYLQEYLESNTDSPIFDFIKLLLEYREGSKLFSTYGEAFAIKAKDTGTLFGDYVSTSNNINDITAKIHSNYSQVRTMTGRLSSAKPNMQNIPQTNKLRNCFIPEEGYVFMIIDYDRQELVILASQSKDKTLLASINEGLDLHSHLATGSYRIIEDDQQLVVSKTENKEYRNNHKPVLFGWIYGAGAYRIAKTLSITKELGELVKERLEELLVGAKDYLNKVRDLAVRKRVVRCGSKANRRRFFEKSIKDHSLKKQAGNYKMQSTGASMVKEAMVETDLQILSKVREEYPKTYAVMQVHDSPLNISYFEIF